MREISLHILDLIQNSIAAASKKVFLDVNEDEEGYFVFRIADDGKGISEEFLQKIRDPFVTTRLTRDVGLGIPFIAMSTEQSGGHLTIRSKEGVGTTIEATFLREHLDKPPLGDLAATIRVVVAANPELQLIFRYRYGKKQCFEFDSSAAREMLGEGIDFSFPEVYLWLDAYLKQEINKVRNEQEAT
ncbi:MAG: ATP-binding protein [Acidaminococcaceae bacterium]